MAEEQRVGLVLAGQGDFVPFRADKTSAQVVTDGHARFQEAVLNGCVFTASNTSAGIAPGTVYSVTPPFVLYNPLQSGVNAVVWRSGMDYVSGSLGAGHVDYIHASNMTSQLASGTTIAANNNFIGGPAPACRAFSAPTIPTMPQVLRPFCSLTSYSAAGSIQPWTVKEMVDGEIVVPPGQWVGLQSGVAAAGATPLVKFHMTWEEVKIP